ncbi:hypothetical protein BDR05DRAFT_365560 [Suillus weaverae]|nr:hypothetical protein BDR05DRAFT_365560 [Suillus weaverae]
MVDQRSLLQPYLNQISSLYIQFRSTYCDVPSMLTDLLALQELTIHVTFDLKPPLVQWMSRLPQTPRSLKITGPSFANELPLPLNPIWFHLTDFHMRMLHSQASLLLRLCPDLSSLTIRMASRRGQALVPFTHTKLQSLRIANGFIQPLSDMFNALSLPDLRVLEVSNGLQ